MQKIRNQEQFFTPLCVCVCVCIQWCEKLLVPFLIFLLFCHTLMFQIIKLI